MIENGVWLSLSLSLPSFPLCLSLSLSPHFLCLSPSLPSDLHHSMWIFKTLSSSNIMHPTGKQTHQAMLIQARGVSNQRESCTLTLLTEKETQLVNTIILLLLCLGEHYQNNLKILLILHVLHSSMYLKTQLWGTRWDTVCFHWRVCI